MNILYSLGNYAKRKIYTFVNYCIELKFILARGQGSKACSLTDKIIPTIIRPIQYKDTLSVLSLHPKVMCQCFDIMFALTKK